MSKPGPSKGSGGRPRLKAGQGKTDANGYKRQTTGPKGNGRQEYAHRVKKGLKKGDGKVVHHQNARRSDNSSSNLKTTTKGKNTAISNRRRARKKR